MPKAKQQRRASRHCSRRRWRRRGGLWSGIFGLRLQTVFTTCVLWILTASTTSKKNRISAWIPPSEKRRRITSTLDWKGVDTSPPSLPQWMTFLGSRRRRQLNALPAASRKSGRKRIHVPAGTWRVNWQALLYGPSTATVCSTIVDHEVFQYSISGAQSYHNHFYCWA